MISGVLLRCDLIYVRYISRGIVLKLYFVLDVALTYVMRLFD